MHMHLVSQLACPSVDGRLKVAKCAGVTSYFKPPSSFNDFYFLDPSLRTRTESGADSSMVMVPVSTLARGMPSIAYMTRRKAGCETLLTRPCSLDDAL